MRQDRAGALARPYSLRVVGIARNVAVDGATRHAIDAMPHAHYKVRAGWLQILAFPCNQFLKQESGTSEEILAGARSRGFDGAGMHLMKKVKVNGPAADEVFLFLKAEAPCQIKWNRRLLCGGRRRHRGVVRRRAPPRPHGAARRAFLA